MKNVFTKSIVFLCMFLALKTSLFASQSSDLFYQLFSSDNSSTINVETNNVLTLETKENINDLFKKLKANLEKYNINKRIDYYNTITKKINTLLLSKNNQTSVKILNYIKDLIKEEVGSLNKEKGKLMDLFGDVKYDTICNEGYKYKNGDCITKEDYDGGKTYVLPKRTCYVSNGYGNQFWYGTYRSKCYNVTCNSGYYVSNGNCYRNNNNNYYNDNYYNDNYYNDNYYNDNYYNDNYYYNNNNYSDSFCGNDQHLENGICISNTKYCSNSNGSGVSHWYGTYWGNCYVNSCDNGYYLSNGTCYKNNDYYYNNNNYYYNNYCSGDQHRDGNNCVSNTRSCNISNGYGEQYWDGNYWSTCKATSCYNGYYLSNGYCTKNYKSCEYNQHSEGDYCVSNSRTCNIDNGYGNQYWDGSYWSDCYATSCYYGYHLYNGYCYR